MSKDLSMTAKPSLGSKLTLSKDADLKKFAKEVNEMHGVGLIAQTQSGGRVSTRVNTATMKLEAYVDNEWKSVG